MTDLIEAPTTGELVELLRRMVLIRMFEEKAARLRSKGLVPGFLHPYIGQEAVAVGVAAALGPDDVLKTTHRGHGHLLGRGADPARMYAELFARSEGYNHGKGGSLHMIAPELGFLGANGIVGGGIPLATGAGLQLKRRGLGQVSVSYFGDGAANEGTFHESLNLASLFDLPVLYVVENNLYGEFTRINEHMRISDIADRAAAYGMVGVSVDGNDVLAVREAAAAAVARARAGQGPTLLEAKTYRHRGHYEGDMCTYRPAGELEQWLEVDPIDLFTAALIGDGVLDEDGVAALRAEVDAQLDKAADWAAEQPHPDPSESTTDVYVDTCGGEALR